VALVVVIVVVEALFSTAGYLATRLLVAFIRRSPLTVADRILGTLPATDPLAFHRRVGVLAIEAVPFGSEVHAAVDTSRTGGIVNAQVVAFPPQIERFTAQLGGIGTPRHQDRREPDRASRSSRWDRARGGPGRRAAAFDLANEERTQRGLGALVSDERLVPVARSHSEEMFELKYLGHQSPVAGSPLDRLKAASITYTRAGENLAYSQSVAVAHRALMDSPGHGEIILRPEFTRIGIGVINAGAYGRMVTQLFVAP